MKIVVDSEGQRYQLLPLAESLSRPAETALTSPEPRATRLTPRELEVAGHLVRGLGNKQIASACCISEGTVKTHVHRLFIKCGVGSRVALVVHLLGQRDD